MPSLHKSSSSFKLSICWVRSNIRCIVRQRSDVLCSCRRRTLHFQQPWSTTRSAHSHERASRSTSRHNVVSMLLMGCIHVSPLSIIGCHTRPSRSTSQSECQATLTFFRYLRPAQTAQNCSARYCILKLQHTSTPISQTR